MKSTLQSRYLREVTLAQLRNPMRRFADRVRQLIFQDCYFYRPFSLRDLASVDPHQACAHFNRSFRNPAEFSLCFTGSLKVSRRVVSLLSVGSCSLQHGQVQVC